MFDPQQDFSHEGFCPVCSGYATITGNDQTILLTIDCESCGVQTVENELFEED